MAGTDHSKCQYCGHEAGGHETWCAKHAIISAFPLEEAMHFPGGAVQRLPMPERRSVTKLNTAKTFAERLREKLVKTRRHPMRKEQVCQLIDQTLMEFMEELVKGEGT